MILLYLLCFLSPLSAIGGTVFFYAQHCKQRPERERRIPALLYGLGLLAVAIGGYCLGLFYGIDRACAPPADILCGLAGFFIAGPLAAAGAMLAVGALILLLPSDRTPESR
jgi:hypothetical protein